MTITQIHVPAEKVQVGHIVSNKSSSGDLEVLSVEGWCDHGKITYKIDIGRNGESVFEVELPKGQTLTYTYLTP